MGHRKKSSSCVLLVFVALGYLVTCSFATPINMSYNGIYVEVEAGCIGSDGSIKYDDNLGTYFSVNSGGWPMYLNIGGGVICIDLTPDSTPIDLNRTIGEYKSMLGGSIPLTDVVKFNVYERTISGFPGVVGEIISQKTYADGGKGPSRYRSCAVFYPPGLRAEITTSDEEHFLERIESIMLVIPDDYPIPRNVVYG